MWRLTGAYAKFVRPQVASAMVAILVAAIGGYGSLLDVIRPVRAQDVPVIRAIKSQDDLNVNKPIDCAKVACLALTFDDGPDAGTTPRVLDTLKYHNVKSTFFLIGSRVRGNEKLVRRMHSEGHEIGNHTWSHPKLSDLTPQKVEAEITRAQQAITAAGVPAPHLFRPPYGAFSPMVRGHVTMTVVAWNVDPEDWRAEKPKQIIKHVIKYAKPGAIVDLHDTQEVTADSLNRLVTELKRKYYLVTVSELLNLPPGQPGIFYGR